MNRTTTRLALQLHRFEIGILGALGVLGVALTLLVCSWLDGTGYAACAQAMQTGADQTPACVSAQDAFYRIQSGSVVILTQVLLFAVPFLLAVLTGVAIVGREVERGTARLAWSLAPSRATWFAGRLLPLLGAVAAVGLLTGLAGDRLSASMIPGTNPWASLADFGSRGVDLAARVVFAFAVAVLVGAALGRALPALLVATIVIFLGLGGGSSVDGRILASEAVPVVSATNYYDPANLTYDSGFMAPDGTYVIYDAMLQLYPQPTDPNAPWNPPYPPAQRIVPGTRYPFVVGREVAVLVAGALAALGLAFALVRRARPG